MSASFVIGLVRWLQAQHPEVQGLCHVPTVHKGGPFKICNRPCYPKCASDPASAQSEPADGAAEQTGGLWLLRIAVSAEFAALELAI